MVERSPNAWNPHSLLEPAVSNSFSQWRKNFTFGQSFEFIFKLIFFFFFNWVWHIYLRMQKTVSPLPPKTNKQRARGFLQEQRLVPLGVGRAVGLCRAAGLALRCHLRIDGGAEKALLPLDLGAGHWWEEGQTAGQCQNWSWYTLLSPYLTQMLILTRVKLTQTSEGLTSAGLLHRIKFHCCVSADAVALRSS